MDSDEKILAHIVSVWREARRLFSFHGKEGMLFLTNRHLIFVHKTEAKMKWWQAATQRQVLAFLKTNDIMIRHDGYEEKDLKNDLENKKNVEVAFDDILKINHEDKPWGGVLNLEYNKDGQNEKYRFSIAQDWVKYPIKEPTKYMKVDWTPLVQYVKEHQTLVR
jgi:hypothetical protein